MYICTTKQSLAFFPTGFGPNNISFPSAVFTDSHFSRFFFPKKTPSRKPSNRTISSKRLMFQTSASDTGCIWGSQGVSRMGSLPPPCTDSEHPWWAVRDREFTSRQKVPAPAQQSHPPLPCREQQRAGIAELGFLRAEIPLPEPDARSCSWQHPEWLYHEPPAHSEICLCCSESSLSSANLPCFLLALKIDCMLWAQQAWLTLFVNCISALSVQVNITLLFHICSKEITKDRQVSPATGARNRIRVPAPYNWT